MSKSLRSRAPGSCEPGSSGTAIHNDEFSQKSSWGDKTTLGLFLASARCGAVGLGWSLID